MPVDAIRLKQHAAVAAVVIAIGMAAVAALGFVLALRPCRIRLEAGERVRYHLHHEIAALTDAGAMGPVQASDEDLDAIAIDDDNDLVLISQGDRRDAVTMLNLAANGTARCLDAAERPTDAGRALGYFDFNLTPLPPGAEQSWNVDLVYAALPPDKRCVQAKVKRMVSGADPEFQLKLPPSIEWLDASNRYRQIRDLTCSYRYHSGKELIDRAEVHCLIGLETPAGQRRYAVSVLLTLVSRDRSADDPRQVRDLATAIRDTEDALPHPDERDALPGLRARLANSEVQDDRLRRLADQLVEAIAHPGRVPSAPPPGGRGMLWGLQVASCGADRRSDAERFVRILIHAGFHAFVNSRDQGLAVVVGPYPDRDPALLMALTARYPHQRPVWVAVSP